MIIAVSLLIFGFLVYLLIYGLLKNPKVSDIVKAMTLVLSLGIMGSTGSVIYHQMGLPVKMSHFPADNFLFVWSKIEYPTDNDPGRIYLWIVPHNENQPVSIELPYTKERSKEVEEAQSKVKGNNNKPVKMRIIIQRGNQNDTGTQFAEKPYFELPEETLPEKE